MRNKFCTLTGAALLAAGLCSLSLHAADQPRLSIHDIMEKGFKGRESAAARVGKGEGTQDDFKLLADLTKDLPLNKPEMGDEKAFKEKAAAVAAAAKLLVEGKPGALDHWKKAANCKACHEAHRLEKK